MVWLRLALKHYTSKLVEFKDLEQVSTFGFRGEALSSLCSLADLVVQTATKDQAPRGVRLEYDHQGHLVSRSSVARSVGTTIQLSNLFGSLPVRLREFKRNIKRDYGKALSLIQAYGVISTGVRIVTSNQSAKG
jgi:DNA mismatch repair protein PMS2